MQIIQNMLQERLWQTLKTLGSGGKIVNLNNHSKILYRLHIYQADTEEDRGNNVLRVGEVIWLKLSEVNVSISLP